MDTTSLIVCALLAAALLTALIRLHVLKRNIRNFSRELDLLRDPDYGQPLKVSTGDRDITDLAVKLNEHISRNQELQQQNDMEQAKVRNIISGISHDFRTPMTSSLGYLQMIERSGELSGKNSGYLAIAISKNKYLKELSDEFFELSKLQNENEVMEKENINISNLLADCLMEEYEWLSRRGITPDVDITDGIIIESSSRHLKRIIQNLFSNAEKYAEKQLGIVLSCEQGIVRLVMSNDTSDPDSLDASRVFEPFYKPVNRSQTGTGLGLYVVKCLAERLDFTVSASVSGDGIFTIEITKNI